MRGTTHSASGAAAWVFVTMPKTYTDQLIPLEHVPHIPLAPGLVEVTIPAFFIGLILSHGSGMGPDVDHHNGTIAHSLPEIGPIPSPTQKMCQLIGKLSGGHRHFTHSLLGIALATLIAWAVSFIVVPFHGRDLAVGTGIFALMLTAFSLKVLKIKSDNWIVMWGISLAMAFLTMWFFQDDLVQTLPLIVGLGALVHCLGDALTVGGIAWFYPWRPKPPKFVQNSFLGKFWQSNGWFAFPILGTTNTEKKRKLDREGVFNIILNVYTVIFGALTLWYLFSVHYLDQVPVWAV